MDNVFRGTIAAQWHEDMGAYGDKSRLALLNQVMVHVLSKIAAAPVQERTDGPKTHILDALTSMRQPDRLGEPQSEDALRQWHADAACAEATYPGLEGARLWDIGCGNGYLGAWLGSFGVSYLGVEPSAELIAICKSDGRLDRALLADLSMAEFCAGATAANDHPPTMISIVAVLEHIRDPEESLRALAQLLYDRGWHDVPVFVATLDPDFLLRGLPVRAVTTPPYIAYGEPDLVSLRDPAHWEELFTRTGLWVLEQRPVHLGRLPDWLARDFRAHFDDLHPGGGAKVSPRQGPFYFWLLSRARGRVRPDVETNPTVEPVSGIATQTLEFAKGDLITPMGNLGATTNLVEKGLASYHSEALGLSMKFTPGEFFGQLELSGNYISSRVLGTIKADEDTRVLSCASSDINRSVAQSRRFNDQLFQSMLMHLDATRFAALVTPQRIGKELSQVLGTNFADIWVRNYAGSLLQICSDAAVIQGAHGYRSRLVVELSPETFSETVYGEKKRAQDAHSVIPSLVQAEVIDCFSSACLESNKLHETIDDVKYADADMLHIGWLAARYLAANDEAWFATQETITSPDEAPGFDRLHDLAIAISAMLGCEDDRDTFRDIMDKYVDSERRNAKAEGQRRPIGSPRRGPKEIRSYICGSMLSEETGRTNKFLGELSRVFSFKPKNKFEYDLGLSDMVIVRDIWALIACVADDTRIWTNKRQPEKYRNYPGTQQRERIIAYLQECIAHLGATAGFTITPW